ncbi:MAG: hypothetical protein ACI4UE_02535 [Candidatus Scatovivens sp.]
MEEEINLGIGFVTGRPNVCKIINNYYKEILEQVSRFNKKVNITIFILFDLNYQFSNRTDFYNIIPSVYKNIKIKYITPENIEEEKKKLISRNDMNKSDIDLFFGHGHAKGRNTIMYYAIKRKIDYLLFWDDDEYPIANIKLEDGSLEWKKQDNVLKHLEYIENADITIGYHCGYISPIPYIELGDIVKEEDFKNYIEAISNEVVSWEEINKKMKKDNGITYAVKEIAEGKGAYEQEKVGITKWVVGSTLCLNLKHLDKIPAFYNPPMARGEDTFFSTLLGDAKIIKVPLYHFHDGFLKYTEIMKGARPKRLRKIKSEEENIESRFLKASKGWIKYKPLLMYITDKDGYKEKIKEVYKKLELSIPKINELFGDNEFDYLLDELKEYDKKVKKHYDEYLKTNKVWNELKTQEL